MASIINEQAFIDHYHAALNEAMMKAAEPIIEEALAEVERTMREKLAASLISVMDTNVSFETFGRELRILIAKPEHFRPSK